MQIEKILSRRWFVKRNTFQLIIEWEDALKEALNAKIVPNYQLPFKNSLYDAAASLLMSNKCSLAFEMNAAYRVSQINNKKNVIPWLIDFYIKDTRELEVFYSHFCNCPLVLISSLEVFDYLKSVNCPLNIAHCALSISDKWRITPDTSFKKDFDIMLIGRQNPVLLTWLNAFCAKRTLTILSCKVEDGHWNYYTQDGLFVGKADSRDECMSLLKRSRIGLYSTQGMDGDKRSQRTNGFSQVTPRFLEYLATGNHVIARFADNSDVDYYNLKRICKNVQSYEEFEAEMVRCLSLPVDMKLYSEYLEHHYTSRRANELTQLLNNIGSL